MSLSRGVVHFFEKTYFGIERQKRHLCGMTSDEPLGSTDLTFAQSIIRKNHKKMQTK